MIPVIERHRENRAADVVVAGESGARVASNGVDDCCCCILLSAVVEMAENRRRKLRATSRASISAAPRRFA